MRVALVTGAARGIGRAIAADLARDHALAFTYLKTKPGPLLLERPEALSLQADFTDTNAANEVVAKTLQQFGRLDTIIMNAGLVAVDTDPEAGAVFDLHVTANDRLLRAALPFLAPGAAVVAISSVNAVLPARGAALYSASKAALNTWVRAMAKELGPGGIRVNAVAPGATEIPESPRDAELIAQFVAMTALGRVATPKDIAAAVRFLSSEDAGFITGEILSVSGGYRL